MNRLTTSWAEANASRGRPGANSAALPGEVMRTKASQQPHPSPAFLGETFFLFLKTFLFVFGVDHFKSLY